MRSKQSLIYVVLDILCIFVAFYLAQFLRFDSITTGYLSFFTFNIFMVLTIKIIILALFHMYNIVWKYASIEELVRIFAGTLVANIAAGAFLFILNDPLPLGMLLSIFLIETLLIGGMRFTSRILHVYSLNSKDSKNKRVLIIGAGSAGVMIVRELRNHKNLNSTPVAFIDDDPAKQGNTVNGVPVVGNRKYIEAAVEKYNIDEIIIAIPSASPHNRKEIANYCKRTRAKSRTLPGMYEIIDGKVNFTKIRDVQIEDLLGRDEVKLDIEGLSTLIESRVVMVTGGGGSIGSELCRQIARFNPSELVVIDIYENNLYDLEQEIKWNNKDLNFTPIITSVRDQNRIDEIVKEKKPCVIFHAAAHKHVPLMENNPKDAIKNNVLGTLNVVQAAHKFKVDKFVLISTDKAVNPTNVMGATKRVAEMIIQTYNSISKTDYVAVRFGNVLGSNGSVIPLFKRQIEEGGPVTITDERIIRYFMTIPEACNLVLEAAAMAKGGEIFVLDMGEPVRIIDLARDLIHLSGFEPDLEIPIEVIGLRPGEKLYEELLVDSENMKKTKNEKIFIEEPDVFDYDYLQIQLNALSKNLNSSDIMDIKYKLHDLVPSYKPYKEKKKDNKDSDIDRVVP